MDIKSGDTVFLTEEYNGYPIGTEMLFMFSVNDSGSNVPLCLIKDDRFYQEMRKFELSTESELTQFCLKDCERSGDMPSIAEVNFTSLKPWPYQIISLERLNKEISEKQESLTKLTNLQNLIAKRVAEKRYG